jgi:hypothetical protein
MAAFISKTDYFDLVTTSNSKLACISADDGRSAEVAEATGEDGTIVANNVYGVKIAPSNEYQLKDSLTIAANTIKLGSVAEIENDDETSNFVCLATFEIGTSAGSAPTISASGEEVEQDSTGYCTYSLPAFTLSKKHHAQILFGAFTYNKTATNLPTGVHLKSANYSCSCSITKGEKEGVCLTHDVVEAKIECTVEFVQTGSTKPVITNGTGWEITSPLACSNPDADWPSWSATLTYYLVKDTE